MGVDSTHLPTYTHHLRWTLFKWEVEGGRERERERERKRPFRSLVVKGNLRVLTNDGGWMHAMERGKN